MKTCLVIILAAVLFAFGLGQEQTSGRAGPPTKNAIPAPARTKISEIVMDTFGCKTIELFDSEFKRMLENKPRPEGCFDLDPPTRVNGPLDLKTIKLGSPKKGVTSHWNTITYALVEVPQKGRAWVMQDHISVLPDSVKPPLRVTAEEFVRKYDDSQYQDWYQDHWVFVTGIIHFANSQRIEMQVANSIILEFSSSGMAGLADFSRGVHKGEKVTI